MPLTSRLSASDRFRISRYSCRVGAYCTMACHATSLLMSIYVLCLGSSAQAHTILRDSIFIPPTWGHKFFQYCFGAFCHRQGRCNRISVCLPPSVAVERPLVPAAGRWPSGTPDPSLPPSRGSWPPPPPLLAAKRSMVYPAVYTSTQYQVQLGMKESLKCCLCPRFYGGTGKAFGQIKE